MFRANVLGFRRENIYTAIWRDVYLYFMLIFIVSPHHTTQHLIQHPGKSQCCDFQRSHTRSCRWGGGGWGGGVDSVQMTKRMAGKRQNCGLSQVNVLIIMMRLVISPQTIFMFNFLKIICEYGEYFNKHKFYCILIYMR